MRLSRRSGRGLAAGAVAVLVFLGLVFLPGGTAGASTVAPRSLFHGCSDASYHGDPRLGPAVFSDEGLPGFELIGYHRTGNLTPAAFLAKYYDPTANSGAGGWIYPPDNGYVVRNGKPIEYQRTLSPGQDIDRYGSEYGSFLSPTGLFYWTRAIPPASLDSTPADGCNYHNYKVLKPFVVDSGPIAAWFAQPGGGIQYQLDASLVPGAPATINVMWLIDNGYLQRLT